MLAVGLMLALTTSAVEAAAGPVRDGSMHHESNVEAASHRSDVGLNHGHMQSLEPASARALGPESQDGVPDHGHANGGDHCAHVHGVALLPSEALEFSTLVSDVPVTWSQHHQGPVATSLRRPPRV